MTLSVHSPGAGLGGGRSTILKPPDLDCRPSTAFPSCVASDKFFDLLCRVSSPVSDSPACIVGGYEDNKVTFSQKINC